MITIDQITFGEKIYESRQTIICRGKIKGQDRPVILKQLKKAYPSGFETALFKGEYHIIKQLNIKGVIRGEAFIEYDGHLLIVMEEFDGISLDEYLMQGRLSTGEWLTVSRQVGSVLNRVHSRKIIHKDISPSNILWNTSESSLRLIDFGISGKPAGPGDSIQSENKLMGNLQYISPEQTGRINRTLDHRSDLYSLGATLYELITGRSPFTADDPLELIHCHIAKTPVHPKELHDDIPEVISDIIMKLMEKAPEDRYSGCQGFVNDIDRCIEKLSPGGRIESFPLGRRDYSQKFQVSEKLYGRDEEVQTLLNAFEKLEAGTAVLVLVSGYSGVGKSVLVNEVQKPMTRRMGTFISGKFDQHKRDIPYMSFIQAFRELIKKILMRPDRETELWKTKILDAVEKQGQIIIDVIPELALIIGKQPAVPVLSPTEATHRFQMVFLNFIRAFASKEHPLVIFLDDLQWADLSSLKLLESILTSSQTGQLLIIGAFRDNEVDASHPLMMMVKDVAGELCRVDRISLTPLDISNINDMISDSLKVPKKLTEDFSALCMKKTGGNPFFIKQFLMTLNEEKLIRMDLETGQWIWPDHEERIAHLNITENVVDLMVRKIDNLPAQTREILKIASAVGSRFDMQTISAFLESSSRELVPELWNAVDADFIYSLDERFRNMDRKSFCLLADEISGETVFKFSHDRIQQAAYETIQEGERERLHLSLGRMIYRQASDSENDERLFEIVNHFNAGSRLLMSDRDRNNAAGLNLAAARKAKRSAAFDSFYHYCRSGIALLSDNSWENHYQLTYELYVEAMEAAHLMKDCKRMEHYLHEVTENAHDFLAKIPVYEIQIQSRIMQNDLSGAIVLAMRLLGRMGMKVPENPGTLDVAKEFIRTRLALAGKSMEDLRNLPTVRDEELLALFRIAISMASAVYLRDRKLVIILTLRSLQLIVRHGNCKECCMAYAAYGLVLCGITGEIDEGCRYGELALEMADKYSALSLEPNILVTVYSLIFNWVRPFRQLLPPLNDVYRKCLQLGNMDYAALQKFQYSVLSLFSGVDLTDVDNEMETDILMAEKHKHRAATNMLRVFRQFVRNLIRPSEHPSRLKGEVYDEDIMLPVHLAENDHNMLYKVYVLKFFLSYMYDDPVEAVKWKDAARKHRTASPGTVYYPLYQLYSALLLMKGTGKGRRISLTDEIRVRRVLRKFRKWSRHAPENYLHHYYLLKAEFHRVKGRIDEAQKYYDMSIQEATEQKFMNGAALACEVAGEYYLNYGFRRNARIYLEESIYCYRTWGAEAKVRQLREKYPFTGSVPEVQEPISSTITLKGTRTVTSESDLLDTITVVKTAQTISGEIVLEELIRKLMIILLTNAGARKGILFTNDNEGFIPGAIAYIRDERIIVDLEPGEIDGRYSAGVLNYVSRTGNEVILNRACDEGDFLEDAYISENRIKSIACSTIMLQGQLRGILYLEHENSFNVFTPSRLQVLHVLSAQAAISMENAMLYNSLEKKVEERTRQLKAANSEMQMCRDIAEAATSAKSEFLAHMSHEIRTPMNAVIGLSRLVLKTGLTEKQRDYIRKILLSARSLLGVLNDILDLSKIEAGKMDMETVNFSMAEVIHSLSGLIELKCEEKGILLEINIHENVPDSLTGDPLRLLQILTNLTNNAVKFTEEGRINVDVERIIPLGGDSDGYVELRFVVRDTGIGMVREQMNRIFQSFSQAEASTFRRFGGTGLGLAISRRLIEMMGGHIDVESECGKGTTFTFTAVFGPGDDHPEDSLNLLDRVGSKTVEALDEIRGAGILLVEDNEINQIVAAELLESEGFKVTVASNGREAMTLLGQNENGFDVVLLDLQMPVMDGYETVRAIREDSRFTGLPVIAMTAHAMQDEKKKCLAAGMNEHVTKPIVPNQLFSALVRWTPPGKRDLPELKKQKSVSDTGMPESVPGIYIARALKNIGGCETAYKDVLGRFYNRHQQFIDQLQKLLSEGDIPEAARMVHMIKGVSGNIGALRLHREAGEFEESLEEKTGCSLPESFSNALDEVFRSIEALNIQEISAAASELPEVNDKTVDVKTLHSRIRELTETIETDIVEARMLIKPLAEMLNASSFAADLDDVREKLDNYDAEAALEGLGILSEKLKKHEQDTV